ncbi:hypothetical protein [Photobacterium galatheae]|uniref:Uncharacterized protein n=1 Tax=Photobacterium galatheae TaxID=1654360 RepID=A0A066RTX7_9GAMM|nr:hypothetical protein [Photobacterium galatheae]KDM91132.1 hypothetical protein EA58_13360 [Photobacterium galatheae]MCM0150146.1 hypothetical protein [Photobacterium galatheae]
MKCAFVCLGMALFMAGLQGHQRFSASEQRHHSAMDIIRLSSDFIEQTNAIQQAPIRSDAPDDTFIPGMVVHPEDGYVEFERPWCFSAQFSVHDYQTQITALCHRQNGRMRGEWCVEPSSEIALFSASLGLEGSTCHAGGEIAVIHVYRPLGSPQDQRWQFFARAIGFTPMQSDQKPRL